MKNYKDHMGLLGHRVRDCITENEGVVTSITFDLYGCIQALVTIPAKDGEGEEQCKWYDVSRVQIMSFAPVMPVPDFFGESNVAADLKGPAEKGVAPSKPLM